MLVVIGDYWATKIYYVAGIAQSTSTKSVTIALNASLGGEIRTNI